MRTNTSILPVVLLFFLSFLALFLAFLLSLLHRAQHVPTFLAVAVLLAVTGLLGSSGTTVATALAAVIQGLRRIRLRF